MHSTRTGLRIGIIGGGQLGRMMILAGKPLGFLFGVVTPSLDDPAAGLADHVVLGALTDPEAILALAAWADVTTYEIEHINTEALEAAELAGARVEPSPRLLRLVQDKLEQKRHLQRVGIPVPEILDSVRGYPVVQKARFGGYDGRGVAVLRSDSDARLSGSTFFERCVDIERELAVVVARSTAGETRAFPVVEMEFDAAANICSRVIMPASIPSAVADQAQAVALEAVAAVSGTGVIAVELFYTTNGEILVNELAPRPHNSGHPTIECCETNQFEQHLRAITGLPLGSTRLVSPGVMINLLGSPDAHGAPSLPHIDELLRVAGVHIHLYGKREVHPHRKMGHVTITAATGEEAGTRAQIVSKYAVVEAEEAR